MCVIGTIFDPFSTSFFVSGESLKNLVLLDFLISLPRNGWWMASIRKNKKGFIQERLGMLVPCPVAEETSQPQQIFLDSALATFFLVKKLLGYHSMLSPPPNTLY
jgi:hypothetical protein